MSAAARLHISLPDVQPAIWRRVEVPSSITLKQLHNVMQAVFGWQSYHLFEFDLGEPVRAARNMRLAAGVAALTCSVVSAAVSDSQCP